MSSIWLDAGVTSLIWGRARPAIGERNAVRIERAQSEGSKSTPWDFERLLTLPRVAAIILSSGCHLTSSYEAPIAFTRRN